LTRSLEKLGRVALGSNPQGDPAQFSTNSPHGELLEVLVVLLILVVIVLAFFH
jgi:hypothetical protein